MTDLDAAVSELALALESCSLPYMLIGGLAVSAWGEPRSTLDVDVSVWAEPARLAEAVGCLSSRLRCRTAKPLEFIEQTRVLPLESAAGIRMDVVFGVLPLQREGIQRARSKIIGGRSIPVASVEDLLLMKLISEREKDIADARALLRRFKMTLDREYVLPKLKELAEALARPDILAIFTEEINGL